MFQYAAGRALADKHRTELKLDITAFPNYRIRKYGLGYFNIKENFAIPEEIRKFTWTSNRYLKKILGKIGLPKTYVKESYFHFAPQILSLPDNRYLEGFWQSEKYFKSVEAGIRREFSLKPEYYSGIDQDTMAAIKSSNAVSVHIRRSDYVSNSAASKLYSNCSLDYYSRAVAYVAERESNLKLFMFSDDIAWVRQNLHFQFPIVYVDHGADRGHEDMALMSMCRHNIIANSTFSWWGAWLNPDPKKIVIAPQSWFRPNTLNDQDLIPEPWVKLEAV
jgi:hypothetical protein